MKLFLECIHASLLVQLSHRDDSLIPYVGSCIYRRDLVYILPENWVPTLVAGMGCSSACYTQGSVVVWWKMKSVDFNNVCSGSLVL